MRIVLVGGGSGGHFYPLIAVAEEVRVSDIATGSETDLYYMGPDPYNKEALERLNIKYSYCPAGKKRRYFSFLNFFDKFKTFFGIFVAIWKLYVIYPDIVMSKGGYTSIPVVTAAWILRIPILIHESDATPGKANLFAKKKASYIAISYDDAAAYFPKDKVALTGVPIRSTFFSPNKDILAALNIPTEKPLILVTGGSLGAERINNLILDSLDELLPNYTIVHQVGTKNTDLVNQTADALITDPELKNRYIVFGHTDGNTFSSLLDTASLIISRAGSTTIAEIALKGKPSILIPIPEDISHDQRSNAYAYARTGAATVIEEHNMTDSLLTAEIIRIMGDRTVSEKMSKAAQGFARPGASKSISNTLFEIGREHE